MKKRRKRILCVALSVLLVVVSFRIAPMQRVEASSLSTEATAEILMTLWNLMVNAQIATGAGEMVANYEQEKLTFEVFMDTLAHDILGMPDHELLGEVSLTDGTVVDLDEFVTTLNPDVEEGETGSITLPNEQQWGRYRIGMSDDTVALLKAYDGRGTKPGQNPDDPEEPNEPQFDKIAKLVLGAGTIAALVATMEKFWGGEIEGIDLSLYQDEYIYTGEMVPDESGNYLYEGVMGCRGSSSVQWNEYTISQSSLYPHRFCLLKEDDYCKLKQLSYDGEYLRNAVFGGTASGTCGVAIYRFEENFVYANFPIFDDEAAALNYLQTGDDTGCLNKVSIDRQALTAELPTVMAAVTGVQLAPSALQSMYANMKSAYQTQVKPQIETSTDTETNTKTYAQAMTQAVTETETGTEPGTGTEPSPTPTPEPETEEETTPEETDIDVTEYKVDLKEIFPFCIPFDFIDLLRVLDAEPEAPSFEVPLTVPMLGIDERYEMSLSCFDDVMVVFRKLEVVSFIVMLMFVTHKMIKW